MNINDKELSVVVPKVKWTQIEEELKENSKLIQSLLVPSDNVVIVEVRESSIDYITRNIRLHRILSTEEFKIQGGGELVQQALETERKRYDILLKEFKLTRKDSNRTPCSEGKDSIKLERTVIELTNKVNKKDRSIGILWVALSVAILGLILSIYL